MQPLLVYDHFKTFQEFLHLMFTFQGISITFGTQLVLYIQLGYDNLSI